MKLSTALLALVCLSAPPFALGADDLRVLTSDAPAGGPAAQPAAVFEAWLRSEFDRQIDRRSAAFETMLKSRAACEQWQKDRREFFLRQIGGLPERTPLNPQVVGKLEGDGYRIEKILLETRPQFHLSANLYLPTSPPPWPAVLVACGHSHEGKAVGQYQRISILLARHGMAAICYDPIGQGERYQILDHAREHAAFVEAPHVPTPHPMVQYLCTTEHTLIGLGSALVGSNVAQFRIWDGMRVIDYLQSRPDIQSDKIGCCGNSGGGTETAYLMALDDRIAAAAPGCYLTTFRRLIETKGPQDGEQNIFGQIAFGMDEADYPIMTAPRPVLICAGVRDATFDFRGTAELYLEAKRFYSRLGIPERIDLNAPDAPHGFTLQQREATARFMHRRLLGREKEIREVAELPDQLSDQELWKYSEPVWTPQQLQCTPGGQVLLSSGERTAMEINAATAQRLRAERAVRWNGLTPDERRRLVAETIGAAAPAGDAAAVPKVETLGTIRRDGITIHKLALSTEGGVRLPALAFVPEKPTGSATLYLHGTGMAEDAGPGGPIEKRVRAGQVVLAAELRGIGETETGHGKRVFGKGRFGPDNLEIFLAYLMGRSFVGMRTDDVRLWSTYLANSELGGRKPTERHLVAVGEAGIPALHAAALSAGDFRTVTVRQMIESWEAVVAAPETFNQSVNVVHGALRHYDLADLVPLARAEKVSITETVDALGRLQTSSVAAPAPGIEVTVAPMVVVRERPGITGAGWVSAMPGETSGTRSRLRLLYPNHPDDFGGSAGTGASISVDGGLTWTAEPDDTPLPKMIDQWFRQLTSGELIAIGLRRVPDPKTRTEPAPDAGADSAWVVGHSVDRGATWKISDCSIECPASLGVIARPLPPVLEEPDAALVMPAYSWSAAGSRALLLSSKDRGRSWTVRSTITDAASIRAAGVPVTTPWMETTIARTADGGWLAVVRTGSSSKSTLIAVRSADGRTWEAPVPLVGGPNERPIAGKLPSLARLAGGVLVLLTANSNNHCRLYVSADGAGRSWSEGSVVTSQSGGNTSMAVVGDDRLVVITPANSRLHAWPVKIRITGKQTGASPIGTDGTIGPPTDVQIAAGPSVRVSWSAPAAKQNVVRYRVTPRLIAAGSPETEVYPYATIETADASTHLDLGRVLSIGGRYRFTVSAVDREARISESAESAEAIVGLAAPAAAR